MTPRLPAVATLLLRALLPPDPFEAIAGDLAEAWSAGACSRARYWRLAVSSILAYHRDRLRAEEPVTVFDSHPAEGDGLMRSLTQDLGYGWRLLRRAPGFTVAAMATLALGIGANTAIFSMVNVLTLRPLAYHEPGRVAFLLGWNVDKQEMRFNLSHADFVELRERARSLEEVAGYSYWSANFTGGDMPERAQAYRVTANTFALLGVPALLGRGLLPEEGRSGARAVIVISHGLWQRRFGGDAAAVGREVHVDGRPHTIVGVMPAEFEFPVFNFKGDLWAPLQIEPAAMRLDRRSSITVIARLREGVSDEKAQADVDTIMRGIEAAHPDTNRALGARVVEMGKLDDEQAGSALVIVVVTVAVVLLLACANVANLLLARGVSRQRELAVRSALGAGRWRIVRQLLAESVLLALGGGVAGVALAFFALEALHGALPEMVLTTVPNIDSLGIDAKTLVFTLTLSILTSLIFGVLPAVRASRPHFQDGLREASAAGGSAGTRRLRSVLVVAEVALSTVLLIGAGLLVRSYQNLQRLDPGFTAAGVLTLTISLPEYRYGDADAWRRFFEQAEDRIAALPGVESAAFVNVLPFSTYNRGSRFSVEGQPAPEPGREPYADYRVVSPSYFRAMQIPVVSGRAFDGRDRPAGAAVAVVNRALARRYFDGRDPIGGRLRMGVSPEAPWLTIVGVAGDVRHASIAAPPIPEIYRPLAQAPTAMMMLAARVSGDPALLIAPARAGIQALDPAQPVYHVKPLRRLVDDALAPQTSAASLVGLFSAVALVLAMVGTYGVLSYAVSQQRREFGVRMALGAQRRDVVRVVVRRGLALVLGGVAIGVVGALGIMRLLVGALQGVGTADPATYGAVVALLVAVGSVACGVPALRAGRVDPVAALRAD